MTTPCDCSPTTTRTEVARSLRAVAAVITREGEEEAGLLEQAIVARLQSAYRVEFGRPAANIVESALTALPEGIVGDRAMQRILTDLDRAASEAWLPPADQAAVEESSETAYRLDRGNTMRALQVGVSFSVTDQMAVDWLREETPFWVGKYYSGSLSTQIRDVVRTVGLEAGQTKSEVAAGLREVLGSLGKKSDNYWNLLAVNGITRARNFGSIGSFEQGGVTEVEVLAVGDSRTSAICLALDGRIYRVEHLSQQRNSVIGATPDQLRTLARWTSVNEIEEAVAGSEGLSATDALARIGVAIPPYHANCRTTLGVR